jgi:superfamily II DNA or RNA helicase
VADERAGDRLRAPAIAYRRALGVLMRAGVAVDDQARGYETLALACRRHREPFPHQAEALAAWLAAGKRGVVVLPTGAGKSYVAELAIANVARSTLIVAPTIDLMNQWIGLLSAAFGPERVGAIGGGLYDPKPLTATTYDSAYLHMDRLGDRFGLIVFDECHHLPGPSYAQGAECAIAPFRLGLTATPERSDGAHALLDALIGPEVYRRDIKELAGEYLADYEVVRLSVALTAAEREAHDRARAEYRGFVAANGIAVSRPQGWGQFIQASCRSRAGRSAWRAWREQKRIALQCEEKLRVLGDILVQHAGEQVLVFTADNDTVYTISRRHLMPAITHQTHALERQQILADFNAGKLRGVVTSKVLNEGVDMPAASVGVILSGSASVREHVQRLGRILRRQGDKEAVLYEVVTAATGEEHISDRRRDHGAYR